MESKNSKDPMPHKKTFLITGGTGFIGRHFIKIHPKDVFYVLTRQPLKDRENIHYFSDFSALPYDLKIDYVLNLAGRNISNRPWTKSFKIKLMDSRIETTRKLRLFLEKLTYKPKKCISVSAIGFYGPSGSKVLKEETPKGEGFSSDLCKDWEKEARKIERLGISLYITRLGVVLDPRGGILKHLVPFFRWGMGYHFSPDPGYFSWVSLRDVIRFFDYLMENNPQASLYNVCVPEPLTHNMFYQSLSNKLNRPNFIKIPVKLLEIFLGDFGKELLTGSYRASPSNILTHTKFQFHDQRFQ